MGYKWTAKWIIDSTFQGQDIIDVYKKEHSDKVIASHGDQFKNHHMIVRKKFIVDKAVNHAIINITADDYYKLYINDKFVGQGPAQSYHFQYNYNVYDIFENLVNGENIIAVHVFYNGEINRVYNSGDMRQGLIVEVIVDDKVVVATDNTWKYENSLEYTSKETIGYKTQFVEDIDQRLKIVGWRKISFDDSNWKNVVVNEDNDYTFVKQLTPPLEVYDVVPQSVKKTDACHYLIDFGREVVGCFSISAKGYRGQVVEIRCGEELQSDDSDAVMYQMRCSTTYKDCWTLSGEEDVLEQFDYKAYRYVEVITSDDTIDLDSIKVIARHYPYDESKCIFSSSNDILNQIWSICKNAVVQGAQEVFVDCPQREKGQYLGDATVTALSHAYISGDYRLYKKALKDFSLSSFICKGLMAVAPGSLMQEIADYSLQYPSQLLTYYKHTGDIDFLKEIYPTANACVKYFDKYKRADGLIENVVDKWNLVDWPDNLRDDYDFNLTKPIGNGCHNVINAFYINSISSINEINDILGIEYQDEFSSLKKSYINAFYDKNKKLFVDAIGSNHSSLHSNVMALYSSLAPKEAEPSIVNLICQKKMNCGVYMAFFLLKALAQAGKYQLVYDLIMSKDEHSWYNMIREGATTCFEAWGKQQKWNTSLCHPWASAPIIIIIEDIMGIKPYEAGWQTIQFRPHIPKDLDISLKLTLPKGCIHIEYEDNIMSINNPHKIPIVN